MTAFASILIALAYLLLSHILWVRFLRPENDLANH